VLPPPPWNPRASCTSCDAATLARDVKRLGALGYRLVEALPVDLFRKLTT
jgi:tRNA/tmRNA/rRNA uracil-C5-methylase (TrmA/RlmC/RlmD family)